MEKQSYGIFPLWDEVPDLKAMPHLVYKPIYNLKPSTVSAKALLRV